MKILVVDDDKTFLDKMEKHLELDNHSVVTSSSSIEALEKINQENFELILTDLKMPDLSGVDLLKKARERGNNSIFIVITGYGTIESAVEAIKTGAYDYLSKPFELTDLKDKIKEVEQELILRDRIKIPRILERLRKLREIDINSLKEEFPSPFLVISDKNPEIIIKKFDLAPAVPIKLNFNEKDDTILLTKLFSLKSSIEDFAEQYHKGTIILTGVETLSQIHNWENVKQFLLYVQSEILSSELFLLVLIDKSDRLRSPSPDLYFDALSSFVSTSFDRTIEIISHIIRKNIILLLQSQKGVMLSFNEIFKKLSVKSSSVLAFHLNKLVKTEILIKEKTSYTLSPKGQYVADIIEILEKFGESGPLSPIKVYRIPDLDL